MTRLEHRQRIHDAVYTYLGARRLAALGYNHGQAPEPPDLLALYYQLERFGWRHLWWPGGLEDQPHQLMFELDCVDEAVQFQAHLDRQAEAAREGVLAQLR